MKNSRRDFLKLAGCSAGLAIGSRARAGSLDRPNILLFLDDQERQDTHGLPLSLPNRERLKKSAVEFTRAYCTYPLCSPSRATIMTGRYPHQAGITTNVDFAAKNPSLPSEVPNLGRVFSEAGYKTAYFGKWHLSRRAQSVGNLYRYGFDSPHVSNQLLALGSDPRVTRNAAAWIGRGRKKSPWLMVFSPINPHDICFPFLDRVYKADRDLRPISLPKNWSPTVAPDIDTVGRSSEIAAVEKTLPRDREEWERYLRFYCLLVEEADRHLGRVLDALEQSGQWDNTVVVFTSDHGEMGGSHGLAHKAPTMYEENLRVPLWISAPGRVDGFHQCRSLTSHLDLVPTLCSMAGVDWPEPLAGIDLSLVLDDNDLSGARELYCQGSPREFAVWRGVLSEQWKYWRYSTGEELLFQTASDPLETTNLAPDPAHADVLVRLRNKVKAWRMDTGDPVREGL